MKGTKKNGYRLIPLESNPSIFNDYFHQIGLKENFIFNELFSFDYKEVQDIKSENVYAVILNFLKIVPNAKIYNQNNFVSDSSLFYMHQTDPLTNACGVVAGIHSIANISSSLNPISKNSLLEEFIKEKKTPEEYAQDLSENEKWKEFHLKIASNGSSQIPEKMEDVKHHYVSFVINKGNLYELDGRLNMPYKVNENVKQEELLDKVIDVVKGRLQRKEMNNLFSIMFIEKN